MYGVFDNEGKFVKEFPSYPLADHFRNLNGRPDWKIVPRQPKFRQSTPRQRKAVEFCEKWLDITFIGDKMKFSDCSSFLAERLELAKATAEAAKRRAYEIYDEVGECDPLGLL